jgi:hypothetical protein
MPRQVRLVLIALTAALLATGARAWGADGHRTIGALADRLIEGTHAQARVRELLDGLVLEQAALWADCAKGVDPAKGFAYDAPGKYPECAVFETPEGEAAMADFVRRNDSNCPRAAEAPSCHAQYHFTDEAIQRPRYRLGDAGTRRFDVVAAITATIRVLQGQPAPPPFDIRSQREALLLLAHYAGDIAQPLHVGVLYLDGRGWPVDPDRDRLDRATDTQGGNRVATIRAATNHRSESLHATWDDLPEALNVRHIDHDWLGLARRVQHTPGRLDEWSTQWADDTLAQARIAWAGLEFSPLEAGQWSTTLTGRYDDAMAPVKKRQLTLAGARLAQTLMALWP